MNNKTEMIQIPAIPKQDAVIKYSNGEVVLSAETVESLPQAVKSVIEAKKTPCIVDYTEDELSDKLIILISGMYQDAGQTISPPDLAVFASRLQRKLFDKRFLHFGELEIACSNGSEEIYGKNFGINLLSVLRWIDGYKNSEEHKQYAFEVSKMIGTRIEPTEEEKENIAKSLALKTFQDYNDKKDIEFKAVTVYDYLDRKGLIKFTVDQKKQFYADAHVNVKKQLSFKSSKTDNKIEVRGLKNQINNIGLMQAGSGADDDKLKLLLKNEGKHLALCSFFDDLITFEQDLEILLSNQTTF